MSRTRPSQRATQRTTIKPAELPPAPGSPGSPEYDGDETAAVVAEQVNTPEVAKTITAPVTVEPYTTITMVIPLAAPISGSMTHRVHIDGHLKGANGATMIRLRTALDEGNHRLRNGKHVQTYRDVMNWLMEEVTPVDGG